MSDETGNPEDTGNPDEIGKPAEGGTSQVPFTNFEQSGRAPRAAKPAGGGEPRDGDEPARSAADLESVFDVPVNIAAVLGRTNIEVSELLQLAEGDVVELDRKVGEAIDIFVNNRLVARGEVVLVEDRLGVTMTEIIKSDRNA